MIKIKKILLCLICIGLYSCTNSHLSDLVETENSIYLKWNKPNIEFSIIDAKLGLAWCYSNLGAKTLNSFVLPHNETTFTIKINRLGFNQNAINYINKLHNRLKETQEYKQNNAIDLGRYVSLLIGASEHYYKITGVPENLNNILENYQLKIDKGYVDNSLVSNKHRIVEYSKQNGLKQLFLTSEVEPVTQEILEYETIEIMENGQLKYGVFDVDGIRKSSATPSISNAGKPAKCMWCHESKISRLFSVQNNVDGFLTYLQLKDTLSNYYSLLNEKQFNLVNGIDFTQTQDHTKMELLYISFMEPSAEVLSKEWHLTISEVQIKLQTLNTHTHEEFPLLGDLYQREEVEQFAPFTSLQVSSSVREESPTEVNHIN